MICWEIANVQCYANVNVTCFVLCRTVFRNVCTYCPQRPRRLASKTYVIICQHANCTCARMHEGCMCITSLCARGRNPLSLALFASPSRRACPGPAWTGFARGCCWLQRTAVTSGICFASIVLEGILTRVITHSFRRRAYRGYVHYMWNM